jgi:uncharacterized membrane protein YkgB
MKKETKEMLGCFGYLTAIALLIIFIIIPLYKGCSCSKETDAEKPLVHNSDWDGSVKQVKEYLEDNLKDSDSYESVKWFTVVEKPLNGLYAFGVRHIYRAKNSFGGYVIEDQIFYMDEEGNIVDVVSLGKE